MSWANRNGLWALVLSLTLLPAWAVSDEPTLELLEFLAEWRDEEGEWVDPVALANDEKPLFEEPRDEEASDE